MYAEGLEYSPDNAEIMTTIGLLFIRMGDNASAFDQLGRSLSHDPRNSKTILAVGSVI